MVRQLCTAAVALIAASASVPANAAETTAYYAATPATAPEKAQLIADGMVWKWNNAAFVANKGPQRDAIVCATVAQRAGKLAAFSAGGQAFDADALAKCNARAK